MTDTADKECKVGKIFRTVSMAMGQFLGQNISKFPVSLCRSNLVLGKMDIHTIFPDSRKTGSKSGLLYIQESMPTCFDSPKQ